MCLLGCRHYDELTFNHVQNCLSSNWLTFNGCEIIITELVNFRVWKLNFYKIEKIALTLGFRWDQGLQLKCIEKQNSINKPINDSELLL